MKLTFNKYWILISVGIVANVLIFSFLSKNLETKVANDILVDQSLFDMQGDFKTNAQQQIR